MIKNGVRVHSTITKIEILGTDAELLVKLSRRLWAAEFAITTEENDLLRRIVTYTEGE